ncbi:YdcF family protein [Desulfococcaceae bacterium HSG8]|nr:YdcF family protein [Desulfococcaceae bacterium HSG8]
MRNIVKILKILIVSMLSLPIIAIIFLITDGHLDNYKKSDAGVVLGNKVNSDGTLSPRLKGRLTKAYELYKNQVIERIIVSGAIGIEGIDEALTMKKYLNKWGVPENRIIADSNGTNTYATAKNVKEYMDSNNWDSVVIITQYHHISRTRLAFHRFGIKNATCAHADYYEIRDIFAIFRELAACCYYLIRDYQ